MTLSFATSTRTRPTSCGKRNSRSKGGTARSASRSARRRKRRKSRGMMTFDSRMKERKGCAAVGKGGGGKSQPGLCCTIGRVCIYGIYTSDVTKDEIRARGRVERKWKQKWKSQVSHSGVVFVLFYPILEYYRILTVGYGSLQAERFLLLCKSVGNPYLPT